MSHRDLVMLFGIVFVGAIWAVPAMVNSQSYSCRPALRGPKPQPITRPRSLVH